MAEPWFTFVEAGEVSDNQMDAGGDGETDPVVRHRIGGPVGAEANEIDGDHDEIEHDRIEHEEHSETATPQGPECGRDPIDEPVGARCERCAARGGLLRVHAR